MNLLQNYEPVTDAYEGADFPIYLEEDPSKGSIYIAGPMRGHPQFNFPAFFAAEAKLKRHNWNVFNPARADNEFFNADVSKDNLTGSEQMAAEQFGLTIGNAMARDMDWIANHATAIYMLKGWEKSTGAHAEHALAVALGIELYYEVSI